MQSSGAQPLGNYSWKFFSTTTDQLLTRSILQNEALVPHGCANAARGLRPLFHKLYFCCLGEHSQTEISFKTNFLVMKGENSMTSYCVIMTFKCAKIRWLVKGSG